MTTPSLVLSLLGCENSFEISESEKAQHVSKAYVENLDNTKTKQGLEACEAQGFTTQACQTLDDVLSGGVTKQERQQLQHSGFSGEFLYEVFGADGNRLLEERAQWLIDDAIINIYPWERTEAHLDQVFSLLEELGATSVEPLIELFQTNQDKKIRFKIIETLGNIGPAASSATFLLVQEIKDGGFQAAAMVALEKIGNPEALPALVAELRYEETMSHYYMYAARAVASFGEQAFPYLETLLQPDSHWKERENVALVCSMMPGEEALGFIEELLPLLTDTNYDTSECIIRTLYNIGKPVVPFVIPLLKSESVSISEEIADFLKTLGPDAYPATQMLIEMAILKSKPNSNQGANYLYALAAIGEKALPQITEAFLNTQNPHENTSVLVKVFQILGPKANKALPELLKFVQNRNALYQNMRRDFENQNTNPLVNTSNQAYFKIQQQLRAVVQAIGYIGPDAAIAVQTLEALLPKGSAPVPGIFAHDAIVFEALLRIGIKSHPRIEGLLIKNLNNKDFRQDVCIAYHNVVMEFGWQCRLSDEIITPDIIEIFEDFLESGDVDTKPYTYEILERCTSNYSVF